jgi:hypothetical protein
MPKRVLVLLLLSALLITAQLEGAFAGANTHVEFGHRALHRDWVAWAVGSNTNPLADAQFCGELVDHRFLMNLAPTLEATYDCEVPEGAKIVSAAGYTIYWKPTDGRTDRELRQAVNADLSEFGGPRARLDGERIDLEGAFAKTGVYSVHLGKDSLIRSDPDFPDRRRTKVAAGAWVFELVRLEAGEHRLVLRQRVFGDRALAVFHISVTASS